MSYNPITNEEVQDGSPVDGALLGKIKNNFEAHETNLGDDEVHLTTHDLQIDSQQTAINNLGTNLNNLTTTVGTKAPLASPTLTGIPTAPTATAGTNTTQVATTAFVVTADALKVDTSAFTGSNQSKTTNGYQKLPGGLILQWGFVGSLAASGTVLVTFPIPFPNATLNVSATKHLANNTASYTIGVSDVGSTNFNMRSYSSTACAAYWFAIGH